MLEFYESIKARKRTLADFMHKTSQNFKIQSLFKI